VQQKYLTRLLLRSTGRISGSPGPRASPPPTTDLPPSEKEPGVENGIGGTYQTRQSINYFICHPLSGSYNG